MRPSRVCIVTDELYPLTAGGIGRVVHNLLVDALAQEAPVELHVMFPGYVRVDRSAFEATFGDQVTLHVAPMRKGRQATADASGIVPPPVSFRDTHWHAESLDVMRALAQLESEGLRFDVIEFPDFRGLAYCTLMEKRLGLAFSEAEIAVRIHTTHGVLMNVESPTPEMENLGRFELERKALLDADRVITHLPRIAEFNRTYYAFPESWMERVVVEFPPVVSGRTEGSLPTPRPTPRDLAFVTKLQACKSPESFIRAAALLMERNPDYPGRAILACHSFDREYTRSLRALVPQSLKSRILFVPPGEGRHELMQSSVVVIPSRYESLNLTAYEAAAAGAVLVLNGACPAFDDNSPFRDGVNCFKSDGTVESLAAAMERALSERVSEPVRWTVVPPFWTRRRTRMQSAEQQEPESLPLVSVVLTHRDRPWSLAPTLQSLGASEGVRLELVLVDDASESPVAREFLGQFDGEEESPERKLKVLRSPIRLGRAASRNRGIRACRAPVVLVLEAGDVVTPEFLRIAANALRAQSDFDVVVPTLGTYRTEEQLQQRRCDHYAVFMGDAPSTGLVQNCVAGRIFVARRQLLLEHPFDEELERSDHWAGVLRWVNAGKRFLVTNQVHAYQPLVRSEETESFPTAQGRIEDVVRVWEGVPQGQNPWRLVAPLTGAIAFARQANSQDGEDWTGLAPPVRYEAVDVLGQGLLNLLALTPPSLRSALRRGAAGAASLESEAVDAGGVPAWALDNRPPRYDLVDGLNRALKQVPAIHPRLKRLTRRALRAAARRMPNGGGD